MWLGSVGAILSMILALNIIPLQSVGYVVSVQVIASPQRLKQLFEESRKQADSAKSVDDRLLDIHEENASNLQYLGIGSTTDTTSKSKSHKDFLPVRFMCFAGQLPRESELLAFMQGLSKPVRPETPSDLEKDLRWAKWNIESLEHSLALLQEDVGDISVQEEKSPEFPMLASESDPNEEGQDLPIEATNPLGPLGAPIAQSSDSNGPQSEEPEVPTTPFVATGFQAIEDSEESTRKMISMLQDKIAYNQTIVAQCTETIQKNVENAMGVIALNGNWSVRPVAGRIELKQALGLLLIGITTWGALAWMYFWVARSGGSNPIDVIAWLERSGIPYIGPSKLLDRTLLAQSDEESKGSIWMNSIFEWMLLALGLWIAFRFAVDGNWRTLIIDQPLCALGKLFARI